MLQMGRPPGDGDAEHHLVAAGEMGEQQAPGGLDEGVQGEAMAAGLATFREVLTREAYTHVGKLSKKLTEGYRTIVAKVGLKAYVASAGVNGALMLYPQEIRNYRDWTKIDVDLWRHYWFAMVNRGVLAQPYWWDEQWTISVQHTEADINKHLAAFEEVAPGLAKAQAERGMVTAAAGH